MRFISAILLALALGCDGRLDVAPLTFNLGTPQSEMPTVNVPPSLRQLNWTDRFSGEGSCTHATLVNLFRWQGRIHTANYWRSKYSGGETPTSLLQALDREGIRCSATEGSVEFLEQACLTRRGCGVTIMGGRHMVALVELNDFHAGLLDPNDPQNVIYVPRDQFIAEWLNSGAFAVTPIYTPVPPLGDPQ